MTATGLSGPAGPTGPEKPANRGGGLVVATSRAELAEAGRAGSGSTAVVMTMGALHRGHAALIEQARQRADRVVVTIFVNPLQFGGAEDFGRYPRTLAADVEMCRTGGVDVVFAPTIDELYPGGEPGVRVDPGPLGAVLEGVHRPGHFGGVLTVVAKLLGLTRPDLAFFGEKDFQQLTLIRAMVTDLDLGPTVVGVPTVREADGLALSSRNRYLSPAERQLALALPRALQAGAAAARSGQPVVPAARAEFGRASFAGDGGIDLDYLELTDPVLGPAPSHGPGRLLIAAKVGTTRLIDNVAIEVAV